MTFALTPQIPSTPEMQTLAQSIDQLYTVFADSQKPRRIEGCLHCLGEKGIETLLASSLRQISARDLSAYAASAFLTVGDVADYLYFLPRILEVSATEESWWPDPQITGRAIRTANPPDWPAPRIDAIRAFNTAVIQTAIDSGTHDKLDPWICAIARMGFEVEAHLCQISKCPAAILAYFEDNAQGLPKNRLCNSFWELPCAAHDAIVEWFYSDEIRAIPFEEYGYLLERSG